MENEKCSCGEGCECCSNDEWDLAGELQKLSEEAWSNVVRRKMEAAIEKESGKKLDKVASLAVEHAMKEWKMWMENEKMEEKEVEEYEGKLDEAMGGK